MLLALLMAHLIQYPPPAPNPLPPTPASCCMPTLVNSTTMPLMPTYTLPGRHVGGVGVAPVVRAATGCGG